MDVPNKDEFRSVAGQIVFAIMFEQLAAKLGRRLRHGHKCPECGTASHPNHRPLRRLVGAMLTELAAEGAAEIYWQRRRMTAAVDRMVVDTQAHKGQPAPALGIPHPRAASRAPSSGGGGVSTSPAPAASTSTVRTPR